MTSVPLLNRLENVSSRVFKWNQNSTPNKHLYLKRFWLCSYSDAAPWRCLKAEGVFRSCMDVKGETCLGLEEPVDTTVHQHPTVEEVSRIEDKYTFNPKSLTPNFWYLLLSLNSCLLRALHPRHQLIYVTYKNAHNASHSYCKLTVFCFDLMDSPCGRSSISIVARLCVLNL